MIREMTEGDWPRVRAIYQQGIDGNLATFTARVPEYEAWDRAHSKRCRIVDVENGFVAGFAALSRNHGAPAYDGVAELSLYVDGAYRSRGIGGALLKALIESSEKAGFWTLESVITADNLPSLRLHEAFGFRLVGRRERVSFTPDGIWHDTLIYERRSRLVAVDGAYSAPKKGLALQILPETFCVVKLEKGRETFPQGTFSFTRTGDERSLLCEERFAPKDALKKESGYRAMRVVGTLDFSLVGILADLTRVLKEIAVSVFVVSTYDTDYLLVRDASLKRAAEALKNAGYEVREAVEHFTFRDAGREELPMIQTMFADARAFMRASGNMTQWTGGYPADEALLSDIERGELKLCLLDGAPAAVFALCGEEPTYRRIFDGAWRNDAPYLTVHRMACVARGHGVGAACLAYAKSLSDNVRADTHRDNAPMRALLQKNGFAYCGIIYLSDGAERLAYQWTRE